jgi:hypothetical protein
MEDAAAAAVAGVKARDSWARMNKYRLPSTLLAVSLGLAAGLAAPRATLAAVNLDPFERPAAQKLSPFHTAQAEAAPDVEEPTAEPKADVAASPKVVPEAKPREVELRSTVQPETAQAKPPATGTTASCSHDDECPVNTICENGACRAFERPIDILLYRKEGRSTSFIPFYFSQRGTPGYRVLAPFYFHFWSQDSHTSILAPFYWRVEDYLKRRVVLVIPPYSQTTQPDARSWAVWPFFYLSTKFGWAAPPLLSFKVGDPDHGSAFGMWFLLYFWTRTPASKFDLLFPFAISKRSKDSAFTWAAPLNFYWRNRDDKNLLALPVFYRNEHKTGGNFVSLLGYASGEGTNTNGAFLWLYWYGRSKASSYDVVFPILWSFRSPGANTTIMPPLFHFRSGDTSVGTFALLGWWASDRKEGSNWQLAFPFYFRRSSENGAKALHLWPTGTYQRDDKEGSRYLTMLVPPLVYWRDKTSETDYELLYLRHRDIPGDANTTIIGPYYQRDDPEGVTRSLFPVYWHFRDRASGATAHSFLPLYFRRNSPDEKLTAAGIFPLCWAYHRSFSDGGSSGGLFPLVFFGSRKEKSHTVVFPLFWRFRGPESRTTALLPLFYSSADKTSSQTAIFPLLYFSGQEQGQSYRFQIPLYWHFADQRSGTSTTVALPYFRHSDPQGYAAGILPLIYWGGGGPQRHFALFPLFWWFRDDTHDRTTTVVANYLHRRHGGETTDALFPLFHYRRGAKPGGQAETSLTLFPLFHYRQDPKQTVFVSPLAAWSRSPERKVGLLGPYFWYQSPTVAARGIPLLYLDHTQLDTGERTRMWGPMLAFDGPGHQARALFPLWARYRNAGEQGTYVFPSFFRLRRNDGYRLDTLFPLLWFSQSPSTHTTVVGPYFSHHSTESRSAGLVPFYLWHESKTTSTTVSPLFVSRTNHDTGTRRTFAWLYYEWNDRDEEFRTAFPLWWQWKTPDRHTAVGFPLFWHFSDRRENTSTTLAGPLYWSRAGSERTRGLLPFAWYSRDEQNGASSNALMPFFYQGRTRTSSTFLTLLGGYRRTGDSTWWYALNFFRRTSPESSFNTFVPLWFDHRNHLTDTRTLLVPPLLHYSRKSPERSLSSWFLLFWHKSSITSSSTFGIPLFYDFHTYHQSRFTMLLPLYFRYRNESAGQSTVITPLYFRYSSPTDSTTIAFPLYWSFWSPERSTTVFFPVYYNVRRPTSDSTYIFPNVYYRKGLASEAGTSHLFVFPFWESQIKRPGDYMWEAMLGLVGWERIGRNRFLKLLFIPFELEAAPAAKTAWYGKPPARGRERIARGLDIKSW